MSSQAQKGNRIILLSLAVGLAIASLFVQWGTVRFTAEMVKDELKRTDPALSGGLLVEGLSGLMSGLLADQAIPVTGQSWHMELGSVKVPCWLAVVSVVVGLLITMTNQTGFSDISRVLVVSMLAMGLVCAGWGVITLLNHGTLGVGAFLLTAAAGVGLAQQIRVRDA
jgi:xanthine/uracil permease